MTDEQALTLARLVRDFNAERVALALQPFDLPDGYVMLTITPRGKPVQTQEIVFGIAPDGVASS